MRQQTCFSRHCERLKGAWQSYLRNQIATSKTLIEPETLRAEWPRNDNPRVLKPIQRNGLSLIELLIAVSLISVVLVGISAVATRSVNVQTYSKEQAQATKLAEEQIERVRAFRDRNGFALLLCSGSCSIQSNAPLTISSSLWVVSNFTIWFTVRQPGACPTPAGFTQMKEVVAYAQWTDRRGTHQARKTECFSDWRK